MTKPRVKSTNNILKKVQTDKHKKYKRLVFQESSDDEDDYVLKKVQTDKNKKYKRLVLQVSSDDEDDHVLKKVQIDKNKSYKRLVFTESSDDEDDHVLKKMQIDKNKKYKRLVFKESSDEEDDYITNKRDVKTNKIKNSRKPNDVNSTGPKRLSTARIKEINYQKKLKELCDAESDSDDKNCQPKNLRKRKLNFYSMNEFESEDIALQKITKVDKSVHFSFIEQDTIFPLEQQPVEICFPSLSKDSTSEFLEEILTMIYLEDASKNKKVDKPIDFSFVKQDTTLPSEQQPVEKDKSLNNTDIINLVSSPQNVSRTLPFTRIKENDYQQKLDDIYGLESYLDVANWKHCNCLKWILSLGSISEFDLGDIEPSPQNVLKINKNNYQEILKLERCNSDSDSDEANWKPTKLGKRKLSFDNTSELDSENTAPLKIKIIEKPVDSLFLKQKTSFPTEDPPIRKSFLASLSKDVPLESADLESIDYRVNYTSLKDELCKRLFKLFNEKVFDNKLPEDMKVEWNIRLQRAAGKCYHKKHLNAFGEIVSRSSRIGLATKILDSPDKLRDVLIHEMCHAATWLINNVSDGHGSFWKAWANKARKIFPELPIISRCHSYETKKKYTYRCISCGYSFGRIRRTLDLNTKCCAKCHGKFELLINIKYNSGTAQKKGAVRSNE